MLIISLPLIDVVIYILLFSAIVAIIILTYIAIKIFKPSTLYYAPTKPINQIINELSCPKCRLRMLKPISPYTVTCENCGFTFSIGSLRRRST